jgi:hypothetical protein
VDVEQEQASSATARGCVQSVSLSSEHLHDHARLLRLLDEWMLQERVDTRSEGWLLHTAECDELLERASELFTFEQRRRLLRDEIHHRQWMDAEVRRGAECHLETTHTETPNIYTHTWGRERVRWARARNA